MDIKEINLVLADDYDTILSERSGKDHRETGGLNMADKVTIYGKAG
ncbi:MAG: hypothetical protein HGB21_13390 [Nitrospirae bacterium]|nr:hypothetical protein [Nitrospirota bacterium]NTW67278.1 hypothetical protein [Nitrospirota bacterium]